MIASSQMTENKDDANLVMNIWDPILLEMVFCYNRTLLLWKDTVTECYNRDPIVQTIADTIYIVCSFVRWFVYKIYFRLTHSYVEPSGNYLSLVALIDPPTSESSEYTCGFIEKYECLHADGRLKYQGLNECMESFYSRAVITILDDSSINEILLTMKENNNYIVRVCMYISPDYRPFNSPSIKSNVEFICVEYRHPKMTSTVSIRIPESYFWVGNELLSMGFIRRFLEYQSLFDTYYFDEEYVVNIIDQNIEQYQLTHNNYIVLEEDTFRVISLYTDNTSRVNKLDKLKMNESHSDSDNDTEPILEEEDKANNNSNDIVVNNQNEMSDNELIDKMDVESVDELNNEYRISTGSNYEREMLWDMPDEIFGK